jgi:hypothetical protein
LRHRVGQQDGVLPRQRLGQRGGGDILGRLGERGGVRVAGGALRPGLDEVQVGPAAEQEPAAAGGLGYGLVAK